MYITRSDKPLAEVALGILKAIHAVTAEEMVEYFIIGATARDILMTHVFGVDAGRATRDVDFAVALENWTQFARIKKRFIDRGEFQQATDGVHRLYYQQQKYGFAYPIDLVPFGGVEHDKAMIAWPPDMAILMNVAGYSDALKSSIEVRVSADLVIKVVSIPALAVLKLIAWSDRGLLDRKDAQDLSFLLKHYHEAGNFDRIYEEAFELLEHCNYDVELAGAALLGCDVSLIINESTRQTLNGILEDSEKQDKLIAHMVISALDDMTAISELVRQFRYGLCLRKR